MIQVALLVRFYTFTLSTFSDFFIIALNCYIKLLPCNYMILYHLFLWECDILEFRAINSKQKGTKQDSSEK